MSGVNQQVAGTGKKQPAKGATGKDATVRRYAMQREAQKVMTGHTYRRGEKECSYRITRCHRHVNARLWNPGVDVVHYPDTDRYGYGNLVSCGSTWHCPICSPKITEYRRIELAAALVEVMKRGGEVVMMTLTYRHCLDLALGESLDKFYKARSNFTASQAFKDAMRDVGALGRVFSTEVTYGENGWHPHLHLLILCEKRLEEILARLERLRDYWAKHALKVGLGQINEHGFDVQNGDYAAEYIAKYGREPQEFHWSAAHELTKAPSKVAKGNNITPFGFLDLIAARASLEIAGRVIEPEGIAGLFLEYAVRFQGRQQLAWSPGLREKLGLEAERTDEQIADGDGERDVIGTLTLDEWREVLRLNARGPMLALIAKYGRDALPRIRAMLPAMKSKWPDEPWFSEERRFRSY